jgi:hypothetical protein
MASHLNPGSTLEPTGHSSAKGLRHKYLSTVTSYFIHTNIDAFFDISLFSLVVSVYYWLCKSTNSALPAVKRTFLRIK